MAPDHEVVAADGYETIAVIKAARAMIVDKDCEIHLLGPSGPRFGERPVHEAVRDADAVMLLEDVELLEEDGRAAGFDRKLQRPELHVADRLAAGLGNAEGVSGIVQLRFPVSDAEAREEGVEVLRPIEVSESVAEARVEDPVERGGV